MKTCIIVSLLTFTFINYFALGTIAGGDGAKSKATKSKDFKTTQSTNAKEQSHGKCTQSNLFPSTKTADYIVNPKWVEPRQGDSCRIL